MIPINRYGDCASDVPGTGQRSCTLADFGDVTGFNLHPKSFSLNTSTDSITAATWRDKIKSFDVRPFNEIYDFTQDTPENERSTSSRGIMNPIREGKPQFSFVITKGGCFHRGLYAHKGSNKWDISFTFETGVLFANSEDGSSIGGFDMGMFDVETFRLQQGTDPQSSTVVIQLIDAYQFNTKFTFLTWAELGVNLSKIEGVVETAITYSTNPSTSTTFAVRVASGCNADDVILGLDETANWLLGGTQSTSRTISAVVYRPATQDYLLTLSGALVAGDTVQPTLYNATGQYFVVQDDLGGLYKGKAPLYTVA